MSHRRWWLCGLLLVATAINYMDRQTLSAAAKRIKLDLSMSSAQYGDVEGAFALAFAAGSIVFGVLADRVSVRALYPMVLAAWSLVGVATGGAQTTGALIACRALLGFFEAAHWPLALKTVQRILPEKDRAMGNGLVQSGSSMGAIATPLFVQAILDAGLGWRLPFTLVGAAGLLWVVAWLALVRPGELAPAPRAHLAEDQPFLEVLLSRRFLALAVTIALINTSWQLLRAWLPLFLQEGRGYGEAQANHFTSAYYVATDIGALGAGALTLALARRGWTPRGARTAVFIGASLLAALAALAAVLPKSPWLLGVLLLVGAGLLAVFPCYYAFAQELSVRHQGKINGMLGVCAWAFTAFAQRSFGRLVDTSGSYDRGIAIAGAGPVLAAIVLVLLWPRADSVRGR